MTHAPRRYVYRYALAGARHWDFFFTSGRFLGTVNPVLTLAGLLALMVIALGMIGDLARVERRLVFVGIDAALIMVVYLLGMYLLYTRGVTLT